MTVSLNSELASQEDALETSTLRNSFFWIAVSAYVPKVLTLLKVIILARLLGPEEFGLLAVTLAVLGGFNLFITIGLKPTLVQYREEIEPALNTAFWLVLGISTTITLFAIALAKPITTLLNSPEATRLLQMLSWMMIIDGIAVVPNAILDRQMNFRSRTTAVLGAASMALVVAVGMVWMGFGVWSLVWSQLASSIVLTTLLFGLVKWLPSFQFDFQIVKNLISYGRFILGSSLFSYVNQNIDYLSLSRMRGEYELGVYSMAFRFASYIVEVVDIINAVFFAAYAKSYRQDKNVIDDLFRVNRYLTMFVSPMCIYIITFSPYFVRLILGKEWIEAADSLRFLALFSFFRSINRNMGNMLTVTGRAKIVMQNTLVGTILLVILMPTFVYEYGANGASMALAIYGLVTFWMLTINLKRATGIHLHTFLIETMVIPVVITVSAGLVVNIILTLLEISIVFTLFVGTLIFCSLILILWWLFMHNEIKKLYTLFIAYWHNNSHLRGRPRR